jgi:hypothetical protein
MMTMSVLVVEKIEASLAHDDDGHCRMSVAFGTSPHNNTNTPTIVPWPVLVPRNRNLQRASGTMPAPKAAPVLAEW